MHSRTFGKTGIPVSEIGLGTWQIGGSWGEVPESDAMALLNAAADNGVTFFDTADGYGDGRSESLIGKFLEETHADVFVATKFGRGPVPGWPENFKRENVRQFAEASLKRLGVDRLDLTQLHCLPSEVLEQGEIFEWMRELQTEGKIRYFGASVESIDQARICLAQDDLTSLQVIFNVFRQKLINELFDDVKRKDVAIIVRVPLASGLLTGKFNESTRFAADDHRNFNRDGQMFNVGETFAGIPFKDGVRIAKQLKEFVPDGMTLSQMALRWILDFDAVSTVIPGAKNAEQVGANVLPSTMPPLSADTHDSIRDLYNSQIKQLIRGPY